MVLATAKPRRRHVVALVDHGQYTDRDSGGKWLQGQHHSGLGRQEREPELRVPFAQHGSTVPLVVAAEPNKHKGGRERSRPPFLCCEL